MKTTPVFGSLLSFICSCFCLGTLGAATGPSLINGSFSGKTADGKLPGWTLTPGATVETDSGQPALVLRSTSPGGTSASQEMLCEPDWGTLRFRYRVSVPSITPGPEGWHNARIALAIFDNTGKVTFKVAGDWSKPTNGWISAEQLVELPVGATRIGIGLAIYNATGEMRMADLKVELAAHRGEGIDAPTPQGQEPQWGQEPLEKQSQCRDVVCLNGLWRFMPAIGPASTSPVKTGWGWLRVPGSWRDGSLPAPTRGTGPTWEGFNNETPAAWYQRSLTIPPSWAGRAVILDLQRVSTDAVVLIDGREVGKVSWPGGEVDLTAAVKPGQTHNLYVRVIAVADKDEVTRFMGTGAGQILKEKFVLQTRGIIGDAMLLSRPVGAHLTGCGIRTSVTAPSADGKTPAHGDALTVVADYLGVKTAGETTLTVVVRDTAGAEVRRFNTNLQVAAGDGSVTASWPWADPMLWDIKTPNIYTLDLALQGPGINDTLRDTFGFRDFRAEGKRLLLNGSEIRLHPAPVHEEGAIAGVPELIGDALDGLRWAGFNASELWPWDRDERGTWEFDDLWCREADRRGILLAVPALAYPLGISDAWNNPTTGPAWAKRMAPLLKQLRNHPSVIMWVTGTNRFGHGQDQNPVAIGSHTRGWLKHDGWRGGAEGGLKEVDPTRLVFMHAGGPVGDVYTSNNYLCMTPLQEREEWLSQWAKDGDMPVMMVEFGTPLYTSFHRGRHGYGEASVSEPLYTEYCSIYQGPEAYRLESPDYRAKVASTFDKGMLWQSWHSIEVARMHEGFDQLQALFQKNTWRSWRTWGITGGMIPWSNGHGWLRGEEGGEGSAIPPVIDPLSPFKPGQRGVWKPNAPRNLTHYFRPDGMPLTAAGKALTAANQETLAWIAGAPDFVDKTHNVRAGTTLAKQAVIINDGRSPAKWTLTCRTELGGITLIDGTEQGEIAPASTILLPLLVPIPASLKSDHVTGVIHLACTIGDAKHEDTFPFTAFRTKAEIAAPKIALLDPLGKTTELLRSLGISAAKWDGKPSKSLVIIGRNAFAKGGADPTVLADHLKGGGRVLLMEQDPAWLRTRLGLRVASQLPRRAFPVTASHSALAGMNAEAFRDWAGGSKLIPPIDAPNETAETPPYGWRWGARHVVSSAPVEIPHRAGWRPVLTCEFDGAYTPLAEISVAGGVITFCTLDLEDHAMVDPAAERVTRAVFASAASAKPESRAPAIYLGGETGKTLLNSSGILFQVASNIPQTGTVVIGSDTSITDADLDAFLRRGGRALILPRAAADAPLGVHLAVAPSHAGSLNVPAWDSCRGISPGELRRRTDGPAWIVTSGADSVGADGLLAEVHRGKGIALYCQLDSAALEPERLSYNRITRWRWTRVLSQLASNMGILCAGDGRMVNAASAPDDISLAGTWKVALTNPLPITGVQDPHPADKGPSAAALARIARDADETGMEEFPVSRQWRSYGGAWAKADGEVLYRRTIDIPAGWAGLDLSLSLGVVGDFDTAYLDGVAVGSTNSNMAWTAPRLYTVPGKLVTTGHHALCVRVFNHFNGGGLVGKPGELRIYPKERPASTAASLYHPDYIIDFPQGDDPYRYYRW